MNIVRGKLSLLLLSAYALLLLHGLIPHTHHHQDDVQISSAVHHSHGSHHHSHERHGEGEEDETPKPLDKSSVGDDLLHVHSHSGFDSHHHNLSYRAASINKLIPQFNAVSFLVKNFWELPYWFTEVSSNRLEFLLPFSNPHLYSDYGLRGPPALG